MTMLRTLLCVLLALILSGAATGSQVPGHVYVALSAYAGAPPAVQALIDRHREAYLAGCMGPDMGTTAYLVAQAFDINHPGLEAHYQKTGHLITNMLREAAKLKTPEAREAGQAYALGWMTHYCTDRIIHPLVNEFGGSFAGGHTSQLWHKRLELVECEHAFHKGVGNLPEYSLQYSAVPIPLVTAAFYRTYRNPVYDPWNQYGLFTFNNDFRKSALLVVGCSQWMLAAHQEDDWKTTDFVYENVFGGRPPSPAAYAMLMKPLAIEQVAVDPPSRVAGRREAWLRVDYVVRDLRLLKLFCQEWDRRIPEAIALATGYLQDWAEDPSSFFLDDYNLDTGGPEGNEFDRANEWPGLPEITQLLVFLTVTDEQGRSVYRGPADGQFVALPFLGDGAGTASQGLSSGTTEQLASWNEGRAGRAFLRLRLSVGEARALQVKVRLAFANPQRRLYGWPERGTVISAEQEQTFTFDKEPTPVPAAERPRPTTDATPSPAPPPSGAASLRSCGFMGTFPYGARDMGGNIVMKLDSGGGILGKLRVFDLRPSERARYGGDRVDIYVDFSGAVTTYNKDYRTQRAAAKTDSDYPLQLAEFEATGTWEAGTSLASIVNPKTGIPENHYRLRTGHFTMRGAIWEGQDGSYAAHAKVDFSYGRTEWLEWHGTSQEWDQAKARHDANPIYNMEYQTFEEVFWPDLNNPKRGKVWLSSDAVIDP